MIQIKVGRLTLGRILDVRLHSRAKVECVCDCGNTKPIRWDHLKYGETLSCGCLHTEMLQRRNTIHGQSSTRTYKIWTGMRTRCNNPKCKAYPNYGGRGIKVCERWDSFENFLEDVGEIPKGMEIDRINNDGNYELGNVRVATRKINVANRRNTLTVEIDGQTKTLAEWCENNGVNYKTAHERMRRGWTPQEAVASHFDSGHQE